MNSFNPFQMLQNTMNNMNFPSPFNMNVQNNTRNLIDQNQFQKYLPNINDNILSQLAQQARQQGISEDDITQGINFIKQLKQNQ